MKVKEMIELLQKQDPDKIIIIQQGEEYDYVNAYSVRPIEVVDINGAFCNNIIEYS